MGKRQAIPSFDLSLLAETANRETLIAGVDEVGRGALFGPVFAAVVVVPVAAIAQLAALGVKDSKQLSAKKRSQLAQEIRTMASACRVGYATAREIDEINILQASLLAMKRAILKLKVEPAVCLVDGNQRIPDLKIAQTNIIKGDQRSPLIAAASIIAKVQRDELIIRLAAKYPEYDLAIHKGYGTLKHRQALEKYGPSSQHRLSFRPCNCRIGILPVQAGKPEPLILI